MSNFLIISCIPKTPEPLARLVKNPFVKIMLSVIHSIHCILCGLHVLRYVWHVSFKKKILRSSYLNAIL